MGSHLLAELTSHADFSVTVVARQSSKVMYNSDVKVKRVSDALEKTELIDIFKGKDAVVVSLAHSANHDHHRTIMDAAAEAGVKHFIPNHWGSNAELPIIVNGSERSKALYDDIQYLRSKESSGMMWTAIIPGIFFDMAFINGLLGVHISTKNAEIWNDGQASFSASTTDDIAKATAAVISHPDVVKNQYAYTSSFELTQNELLEVSRSLCGGDWDVTYVKGKDKVDEAKATIASGEQGIQWLKAQGALACAALFGGEDYQSDFVKSGRSSNLALGLRQKQLRDAVARICR